MIKGKNEHRKTLHKPVKIFKEEPRRIEAVAQTERAEAVPCEEKSVPGQEKTFAPKSSTSVVNDLTETSRQATGGMKRQDRPKMKWQDYLTLRDEPNFPKRSQYVSTANGKKKRRSLWGDSYIETGFDDTLYDYINQHPVAQRRQKTNDVKSGVTHEDWKDLSHETIRIFNYIYGTQSPEAAYAYMELAAENDKPGAARDRTNIQAEKAYLTQARDQVWRELNDLMERFEAQGGAWKQNEEAVKQYDLERAELMGQEGVLNRQIDELNRALKDEEWAEKQALIDSGEYREATPWDLVVGSVKRGQTNSQLGEELYKKMMGKENGVDQYQEILEGEEYKFFPQGTVPTFVSGVMENLGQVIQQTVNPETAAAMGGGMAGGAIIGGIMGGGLGSPITAAGAGTAGLMAGWKAASMVNGMKSEIGHAYNEMLQKGVSEETAAKVAQVVGGVSAAIDLLPVDELKNSFQILSKGKTTQSAAQKIAQALIDKGVDIAGETARGVAQEGAKIAGTQWASKWDTGEWAYDDEEVTRRLRDAATSSAGSAFLSSTARSVVNRYLHSGATTQEIGSLLNSLGSETPQAVINEGLMYGPNTESYRLAQRLQQRLNEGRSINNTDLGLLYQANMDRNK